MFNELVFVEGNPDKDHPYLACPHFWVNYSMDNK